MKITEELINLSYDFAVQVYRKQTSLKEAKRKLSLKGMNKNSAADYIYAYANLVEGKKYTRTINLEATKIFLNRISESSGRTALSNALLAISQHNQYYESKTGRPQVSLREILKSYQSIFNIDSPSMIQPDEIDKSESYEEGSVKKVFVNSYERNTQARKACLEHYGYNCQVCDLNFFDRYGEIGEGFIHVHHKVEISTIGIKYSVDPIKDLIPVCPNCHAMLHKEKPALSINELKKKLISTK